MRVFKIFITLAFVIFTYASCFPEDDVINNIVYFNVKNSTSDTISLKADFPVLGNRIVKIAPNKTTEIKMGYLPAGKEDSKFATLYDFTEADNLVYVYLKDSVLVKTWNEFFTDTEGKQFFREKDWTYKAKHSDEYYKYHSYTFTILSKDLNLK